MQKAEKSKARRWWARLPALLLAFGLAACAGKSDVPPVMPAAAVAEQTTAEAAAPAGRILLYGEIHGVEEIYLREAALWQQSYQAGLRDLFVEQPYYTAQYLNEWMLAEDDTILDQLYQDWAGTAAQTPAYRAFFISIKENCPETVFYGTDVGHQYNTTGARYLQALQKAGRQESETYALAKACIAQGKYYYRARDDVYRENKMAENFIRAYDTLGGESVMGFYGAAHTDPGALDFTGAVPCMANRLAAHYAGTATLYAESLADLAPTPTPALTEPIETAQRTLQGKTYTAAGFGSQDLTGLVEGYQSRSFWRLENAYEDFKACPANGEVLPYNNYPMEIEQGQVFAIDYTLTDGSTQRRFYRADGDTWQGMPATTGFTPGG